MTSAASCIRRAWLDLGGGLTLSLNDPASGYFCTELDLGWPEVREVKNNHPDRFGVDDTSSLFGGRVVSANISAIRGAGASVDTVAASFGPFMMLSVRPMLHYVLDRPGAPERVIGPLRAVAYGWPIQDPERRDIQLQWLAADPVAHDPTVRTVAAWAGSSSQVGRTYNRTHDVSYGGGSGSGPRSVIIRSNGDIPIQPLLRIYGPCTMPWVQFNRASVEWWTVAFGSQFRIDAGQYVTVNTREHTAYMGDDPDATVIGSISWSNMKWPVLPVRTDIIMSMSAAAGGATDVTQVQASWQDGYLS